jgi:protoporphyrin/coproporphyrin ferrochelatase
MAPGCGPFADDGGHVSQTHRRGVLLVNLGTPEGTKPSQVRRYLRQFLNDPRVIDINPVGKWLLLNLVILPFRPKQSAEAYQQIWTERGSPLLFHSQDLCAGLQAAAPEFEFELAMRYGSPSIQAGLDVLRQKGCDQIVIFPLYPHYASSSTGSSIQAVYDALSEEWNTPAISIVPPFYDHDAFIGAFRDVAAPVLAADESDFVLFSFHSLPERHITKSDPSGWCRMGQGGCCDSMNEKNQFCYRAQCEETARRLAKALNLEEDAWSVAYQSRLTRDPWLTPNAEAVIEDLAKKGIRRVAVMCPAFVADCLETLEEIAMRGAEIFEEHGGELLTLVPSLNAHPSWIGAAATLVRSAAGDIPPQRALSHETGPDLV